MTTERLHFQREHQPAMAELRYETDEDARVREYIRGGYFGKDEPEKVDEIIDQWFKHYHLIARVRLKLGIK